MLADREALHAALQPERALGQSSDYDLNPGLTHRPSGLRPASVLVGVMQGRAGPEILLTRRASRLRHHAGQVAFPGGRQDATDPSPEACALREAEEEVGLHRDHAQPLGRLDPHITVTGFEVTPVVADVPAFAPILAPDEVAAIFAVPLHHIADLSAYRQEGRRWQGQRRSYWVLPYGPWYIWGATARMLRGLALRLAGEARWR